MNKYDVIIIGAGAAGLMCAIEAGKRSRRVLLLDHSSHIGQKIRISGGGRCNFTNIHTSAANYISCNPHFCKSALMRFTPYDFIDLLEKHHISYHEKTLGQLFCDISAKQIIGMLLTECERAGVTIRKEVSVARLCHQDGIFKIYTSNHDHEVVESQSLVVATGGLSIPKIGATGWGYDVARQFGIKVIHPKPALVPLTLDGQTLQELSQLSGVSLNVIVTCGNTSFEEALLFTHRGLSGPAILQISSYWKEQQDIVINLVPGHDVFAVLEQAKKQRPKQDILKLIETLLPKRLAQYLCQTHQIHGQLAQVSKHGLKQIATLLSAWRLTPNTTEGYRTAEVTIGGVDTNELSSKTFEAKKVKGLYFIGEVVDVTGHLGGFNFQWAWSSGYAAGQYV